MSDDMRPPVVLDHTRFTVEPDPRSTCPRKATPPGTEDDMHAAARDFKITAGTVERPTFRARAASYLTWLIRESNFHGTECMAALGTAVIGIVTALPTDTFPTAQGFSALSQLAPEWVWACVTLALPALTLAAAYFDHYWLRLTAMLGHVFWYLFIGTLVVWGNPRGWGYLYFVLALASMWAFIRLALEWQDRAGDTAFGRATTAVLDFTFRAEESASRYRVRLGLVFRERLRRR